MNSSVDNCNSRVLFQNSTAGITPSDDSSHRYGEVIELRNSLSAGRELPTVHFISRL